LTRTATPDDPMRLSRGWVKMSVSMLRAVLAAVGDVQGIILGAVLEEAWFSPLLEHRDGAPAPMPQPCLLSLTALSKRTGVGVSTLSTAKRRLVERGLLVEHPDGRLEPNADYAQWAAHGKHWDQLVEYFDAGKYFVGATRNGQRQPPTRRGTLGRRDGRLSHKKQRGYVSPLDRPKSSRQREENSEQSSRWREENSSRQRENTAVIPSRRREDSGPTSYREDNSEEGKLDARTPGTASNRIQIGSAVAPPDAEPFEAPPEADPGPREAPTPQGPPSRRRQMEDGYGGCLPGKNEPDQAVLKQALAFCEEWFPARDDFPRGLMLCRRQYPTAWLFKVLRRIVAKGNHERCSWRLAAHILDEWLSVGSPDAGPEDALDERMNKIPPSQRKPAPAAPGKPRDNPPYLDVLPMTPDHLRRLEEIRAAERARAAAEPQAPAQPLSNPLEEIARMIERKKLAGGGHAR
jgi:hypothetical protein